MKTCASCGTDVPDAAPRCGRCGTSPSGDAVNDASTGVRVKPPAPAGSPALLCGRYEVVQELGRGGMGVVYRARDRERRNAEVALKALSPELAGDPRAVEDLSREADLAMSLAHPNIISLHNLERDAASGTRFLVMEFVRGETLSAMLERRGPLSADEAAALVRQALAGLEYAHRKGVVHRDVKPSNLMRAEDGTVKLGDFGIARRAKDALAAITGRGSTGTLLYMSPEQLRGDPVDARTDVYSMGCVLYELLTGHAPFRSGSIEWQIQNQVPTPIPSAPAHVRDAVSRAMAKDRAARFPSSAAFASALEGTPQAQAPPVPERRPDPAPPPAPAKPNVPAVAEPAPPAPAPEGAGARRLHYSLVNVARVALIAVMVFFFAAKSHQEVLRRDAYGAAWWAGGGFAVLCFVGAALAAWRAKSRTGRSVGGTWHPAARIFLLLPALAWLLLVYAKGKPDWKEDQSLLSSCAFMSLELLLFSSFFAVRFWRTLVCALLIAGALLGVDYRKEIEHGGLESLLRPGGSSRKNQTPEVEPKPESKTGSAVALRIPENPNPPIPPPPKLGPNAFESPVFFLTCTVVSFGGGAQGQDVLDLSIGGKGKDGRISSVLYLFPQGWRPASQRATDPSNGFTVRVQASTPFQVTAHVTTADGGTYAVSQVLRWR